MAKSSSFRLPRRAFLASVGVGLAGIGAGAIVLEHKMAASIAERRKGRLYIVDHLRNRIVHAAPGDAEYPPAVVLKTSEAISGYASKFVYRVGEPVELHFPVPGDQCASFRQGGCQYGDSITLSSIGLGPGVYRCRYFVDGEIHEVVFSVIDPSQLPKVCLVYPTSTYQAYNTVGGESLYTVGTLETFRVSTLRPLGSTAPHHDPRRNFAHNLLNDMGVDFYAIDSVELHHNPGILDDADLVMLAQHDEYWSWEMRQALEVHLRHGGNLLCLAGNVMFWKVKFLDDDVAIQKISQTPRDGEIETWTGRWDRIRPEEQTIGLAWRFAGYPVKREFETYEAFAAEFSSDVMSRSEYDDSDGLRVLEPEHAVFSGTGLGKHDLFGQRSRLLDVEVDGLPLTDELTINSARAPLAPPGIRPLTYGFAARVSGIRRVTTMVDFRFEGKGRVLNFGSVGWVRSAHEPGGEVVAKVSRNAVELLLSEPKTTT